MPSRFEYERAIKRSGLPPLARFIALVIATWADAETGVIARKHQPAQSVLLEATGMSKSAFLAHRKTLLDEGWLKCKSPTRSAAQKKHAQNVYSIQIPPGKAGSGDDLAKTDKRPGKRREPRSGGDLDLGREATQPNGTEVGVSGSGLGRQATTRVPTSSSTSPFPTTHEGTKASNGEHDSAFAICQPLITAMTDAGLTVSWQMQVEDWQNIARVVQRAGVDEMVRFALGCKTREPVRFARFYLKAGWLGLPPKSAKPRPAAPESLPDHCGHIDCDPVSRQREREDDNGLRSNYPCPECHPNARKDHAA